MQIIAFDIKKRKEVLAGDLVGDTFIKRVKASHYMKVIDGYGISDSAFQKIMELGCTKILVKTPTEILGSGIGQWLRHGATADYGSGRQRFLSLKYMTKVHRKVIIKENLAKVIYE